MTGRAPREVDLLVVGAGPAGAAAALEVARAGFEVLLIERHRQVGAPVRCGEYAPLRLLGEAPEGVVPVVQQVPALTLHLPSGQRLRQRSPGVVIDRGRFDRALVERACAAGAELWTEAPALSLSRDGAVTLGGARRGQQVRGRLIVGADGPSSGVAAEAGLGRPRSMLGLQRTVRLTRPVADAHLYFWAACRYGYGWLFPRGELANLGVAVPRGRGQLGREALAELSRRLGEAGVLDEASTARGGASEPGRSGLVPASGPLPRLAAGRVLLVGDAAGQTDALSGAGIVAALRGGALAGAAAAAALGRGRPRQAGPEYERRWRETLGRNAARSLQRRFELEARWDRNVERAVTQAWLPGLSRTTRGAEDGTRDGIDEHDDDR